MKTQHTPKPWKMLGSNLTKGGDIWTVIQTPKLAFDITSPPSMPADEHKANTRLMTAAPDLLEACKFAIKEMGPKSSGDKCWDALETLQKAIAKAEGLDL